MGSLRTGLTRIITGSPARRSHYPGQHPKLPLLQLQLRRPELRLLSLFRAHTIRNRAFSTIFSSSVFPHTLLTRYAETYT